MARASSEISSLSDPTSGRSTGRDTTSLMTDMFLQRLRRDLPDRLAGDQRRGTSSGARDARQSAS